MNIKLEISNEKQFDVIIVGGGSAGIIAAITAGKLNKKVALIEKNGFLGGISSAVLDTMNGFYAPGKESKKIVGGIPDEIVERLFEENAAIIRQNTFGAGNVITFNPDLLKCIYDDMILEANVEVFFHSFFLDVVMENSFIQEIIIAGKDGINKLKGDIIIDTSGDADVCFKAKVPFEKAGELAPAQTLTTTFRLSNVNIEKALTVSHKELAEMMRNANKSGKYCLPREEGSIHITPIPGVMLAIMTRLDNYNPLDTQSLSKAEIVGRSQAREYIRFLIENVPGYSDAKLISLSSEIGVRETRRVFGEYRLTKDDVTNLAQFEDKIGLCAAPIEDHHKGKDTVWEFLPEGKSYDIPYRSLIPLKVENLLVAGRCFSATHEAHASCRSVGQTMTMGQAVGTAAALCCELSTTPRKIDVKLIQKKLIELGVILDI